MVTGSHVLMISGYSGTKGLGVGKSLMSGTFIAGGHSWCIRYFPDGFDEKHADWIRVDLYLHPPVATDSVNARYTFSLLDQVGMPVPLYTRTSQMYTFSATSKSWSYDGFIRRQDLESPLYLKDDSFQIRCDVTVVMEIRTETTGSESIMVPPSNLHRHLGGLLASEVGKDVNFDVGGEVFIAHRNVLAARSTVFMVELFGPMKEKSSDHVLINDMEARVFRALLQFIYTDSLPEIDEYDKIVMTQLLLVAADRYNIDRLKLICEDKLCPYIDASIVATTMVLAEQHGCHGLIEACFKFLRTPGNLMTVMATDGFLHLTSSSPPFSRSFMGKLLLDLSNLQAAKI